MLKELLLAQIGEASYLYGKDLAATPEALMASKTGAARTANEFTAEAAGFNILCSKLLSGQPVEPMSEEQRLNLYAGFDTKDKAVAFLDQSVETLTSAVKGASDDDLNKDVTAPWGQTMPAYKMALTAVWHMMYHDGQLCLLQMQNGDADVHWM